MSRTLYLTDEQHADLLMALSKSAIAHEGLASMLPVGSDSRIGLEASSTTAMELIGLVGLASRHDVLRQLVDALEAGKMLDHSVTQADGTRVWLIDELAREIVERK